MAPSFPQRAPNPALHPNASSSTSAYSHQDSPAQPHNDTRKPTTLTERGQEGRITGFTGEKLSRLL